MVSRITWWLSSGRPRQSMEIAENSRCSISFHWLAPSGRRTTVIWIPGSVASLASSAFQSRRRLQLDPPQSAVISSWRRPVGLRAGSLPPAGDGLHRERRRLMVGLLTGLPGAEVLTRWRLIGGYTWCMTPGSEAGRDIMAIRLPCWGRVVQTGGVVPWVVVDPAGEPVEPILRFLRDFVARDNRRGSVRSYCWALLRWWR